MRNLDPEARLGNVGAFLPDLVERIGRGPRISPDCRNTKLHAIFSRCRTARAARRWVLLLQTRITVPETHNAAARPSPATTFDAERRESWERAINQKRINSPFLPFFLFLSLFFFMVPLRRGRFLGGCRSSWKDNAVAFGDVLSTGVRGGGGGWRQRLGITSFFFCGGVGVCCYDHLTTERNTKPVNALLKTRPLCLNLTPLIAEWSPTPLSLFGSLVGPSSSPSSYSLTPASSVLHFCIPSIWPRSNSIQVWKWSRFSCRNLLPFFRFCISSEKKNKEGEISLVIHSAISLGLCFLEMGAYSSVPLLPPHVFQSTLFQVQMSGRRTHKDGVRPCARGRERENPRTKSKNGSPRGKRCPLDEHPFVFDTM